MALAVGGQEGGVHEEHVQDVVITLDDGELERSVSIGVRNIDISPNLSSSSQLYFVIIEMLIF